MAIFFAGMKELGDKSPFFSSYFLILLNSH